jgi:hypothetical protein
MDNRFYFTTDAGNQLVVFNYQIAAYMDVDANHTEIFLENGRAFIVQSPISTVSTMIEEWHKSQDNTLLDILGYPQETKEKMTRN